uniref:CNNM transmembrane domain-containing protein n=1 Tax=Spongospora subterranea TaxID=70186 RepID=A0A0H5R6P6_9EUKA|eukprot:CRZ09785.1 hypothetical protein [Spongospora subterranea]
MILVAQLFLASLLLSLSAVFSGLTLGVLGLDIDTLEINLASDSVHAAYAAKILPLRRRGNLLLCTLLFGNVLVNNGLSLILVDLLGDWGSLVLSTSLIVILGEVIPQAVCSRYALALGSRAVPLVYAVMFIMFPIAYPLSKCLDYALGKELGQIYSRKELCKLVEMHHKTEDEKKLRKDEFKIMTGALQFAEKRVSEIMTPPDKMFSLDVSAELDFQTIRSIFESGFSRIPVIDRSCPNGNPKVVGILYTKDLILTDPNDALPVRHLLSLSHRTVHYVSTDLRLSALFSEFKTGRTHIAIVVSVSSTGQGDPLYELKGLVTLEDIAEVIFQDSIFDETDVIPFTAHPGSSHNQWPLLPQFGPTNSSILSDEELIAVFDHLRGTCSSIFASFSDDKLRCLLKRSTVANVEYPTMQGVSQVSPRGRSIWSEIEFRRRIMVEDGGLLLYSQGSPDNKLCLILDGKVHIVFGKNKFETKLGSWSKLGQDSFEKDAELVLAGQPAGIWPEHEVADFTATICKSSRILLIDRQMFRTYAIALGCPGFDVGTVSGDYQLAATLVVPGQHHEQDMNTEAGGTFSIIINH